MSGFEIAGVVLGAFPILYDAAKDLKPAMKKVKDWWSFQNSFTDFVSKLETQEIVYIQVLERLLCPLDITPREYHTLLNNSSSLLWGNDYVQKEVRQQFSNENSYMWFMSKLADLKEAILEVQALLPGKELYHLDSTSIESEIYRLQMAFGASKDRLLARITSINDELHKFLDRASGGLPPTAPKSKSKFTFREIHNEAIAFYDCLAKKWRCNCSTSHIMGITIHPATPKQTEATDNGSFNVLFGAEPERKQLRIKLETVVSMKPPHVAVPVTPEPSVGVGTASEIRNQLRLRDQVKSVAQAAAGKSTSTLAKASLFITGPLSSATFKRRPKKLQKQQAWLKVDQKSDTSHISLSSHRSSLSKMSPTPGKDKTEIENDGARQEVPDNGSLQSQGYNSTTRVRFTAVSRITSSIDNITPSETNEVQDMCTFTHSAVSKEGQLDSILNGDTRAVLRPEPEDQAAFKTSATQSMDSFLRTTALRQTRLYVGLRLTLTLLSLATSAWLPAAVAKEDIFLICNTKKDQGAAAVDVFGPYISRTSRDLCSLPTRDGDALKWNAKTSLLLLGVVLLELFHGQTVEQQPHWNDMLVDGKANDMTLVCAANMWVQQARSSLKQYFGEELGEELYGGIDRCIRFEFDGYSDFGDTKLAGQVYQDVVVPLKKCCP